MNLDGCEYVDDRALEYLTFNYHTIIGKYEDNNLNKHTQSKLDILETATNLFREEKSNDENLYLNQVEFLLPELKRNDSLGTLTLEKEKSIENITSNFVTLIGGARGITKISLNECSNITDKGIKL